MSCYSALSLQRVLDENPLLDSQKVYFSGPLIRCNERNTDGSTTSKHVDWHEVWAQLGGTTLSIWDMSEIEDARRRGGQAPPTYINVTDAVSRVVHYDPRQLSEHTYSLSMSLYRPTSPQSEARLCRCVMMYSL